MVGGLGVKGRLESLLDAFGGDGLGWVTDIVGKGWRLEERRWLCG